MSPFTHQIYSQSSLIVLANYVNVDFRLILFIAKMRQKIEAEIKSDGIKVIKVTHSIKPSLKSILTFWLTWHGALVAMKLDERSVCDNGDCVKAIIRCCNRHNRNEKGECCSAALKVKFNFNTKFT